MRTVTYMATEQLQLAACKDKAIGATARPRRKVTSISLLVSRHMKRLRPAMTNAIVVSLYNYT